MFYQKKLNFIDFVKSLIFFLSRIKTIKKGRKTINQYTLLDKLGQGSFGKVKLAIKNDTKEKFAVKIFRKSLLKKKRCWIKTEAGKKI